MSQTCTFQVSSSGYNQLAANSFPLPKHNPCGHSVKISVCTAVNTAPTHEHATDTIDSNRKSKIASFSVRSYSHFQ